MSSALEVNASTIELNGPEIAKYSLAIKGNDELLLATLVC